MRWTWRGFVRPSCRACPSIKESFFISQWSQAGCKTGSRTTLARGQGLWSACLVAFKKAILSCHTMLPQRLSSVFIGSSGYSPPEWNVNWPQSLGTDIAQTATIQPLALKTEKSPYTIVRCAGNRQNAQIALNTMTPDEGSREKSQLCGFLVTCSKFVPYIFSSCTHMSLGSGVCLLSRAESLFEHHKRQSKQGY